jgi:hypothetical protein
MSVTTKLIRIIIFPQVCLNAAIILGSCGPISYIFILVVNALSIRSKKNYESQ